MKAFIQIKNFKSFENVKLSLKSKNFILGPNGSGKSSLIKLLLFIKRNLLEIDYSKTHRYSTENVIDYRVSEFVDLGSFRDIVSRNDTTKQISIKFSCETSVEDLTNLRMGWTGKSLLAFLDGSYSKKLEYVDGLFEKNDYSEILNFIEVESDFFYQEMGRFIKTFNFTLEMFFRHNAKNNQDEWDYRIVDNDIGGFFLFRLDDEHGVNRITETSGSLYSYTSPAMIKIFHNIKGLSEVYGSHFAPGEDWYASLLDGDPSKKLSWHIDLFLKYIKKLRSENKFWMKLNDDEYSKIVILGLFQLYKFVYTYPTILRYYFDVTHLPTVREIPNHHYLLNNGQFPQKEYYGNLNILKSKNASVILGEIVKNDKKERMDSLQDKEITKKIFNRFIEMNEDLKSVSKKNQIKELKKIIDNLWDENQDPNAIHYNLIKDLQLLNLCKSIYCVKDKSNVYGSIFIEAMNGSELNLAEASSGLLQLLPILFELHYAIREFTRYTLLEQPELHLHPKLQAELSISFSNSSQPIIVETHSEHLIRKLQVLVAKGEISKEDIVIYFFDNNGGVTKVKEMSLLDNGFFSEPWPNGFFDDSYNLTKELLRANKN